MIGGIFHLPLSTGYILAGLACNPQVPPVISLDFQIEPPKIDNTKSPEELGVLRTKSVSSRYNGEFPIVGGLTDGRYEVRNDIRFVNSIRRGIDEACVYAKNINITVSYSSTVYISGNYKPGSCRYAMTQEHEMRHVNTDINTLKEFLPYIRQAVEKGIGQWGNTVSVPENQTQRVQGSMAKNISDLLEHATDSLQQTRTSRQQKVDTREEYLRMSAACPNEPDR